MTIEVKIELNESHESILEKVNRFLLDVMDIVEQSDAEAPIIAAHNAFEASRKKLS